MANFVRSVVDSGNQSIIIEVECHMSKGLPNLLIVGLANKAVDEARERVRSAMSSSKLQLPRKRITINLAPADLPKASTHFDLSIAAAILSHDKKIDPKHLDNVIVLGELGLDGKVRSIRGMIGALMSAKKLGVDTFYIPRGNLKQAKLIPEITVYPIRSLSEFYRHGSNTESIKAIRTGKGHVPEGLSKPSSGPDFSDIIGQERAKRALEIAAAGNHNVLLNGPPGTGKSMLAKAYGQILPALSIDEVLEITHLHSLTTKQYDKIITERPIRSPHHSASSIAIIGGGQTPRPGEISLAHKGVLFFDEFPEFKRDAIEALRQPLEDGIITVSRAKDTVDFPADFTLIATSNPCPCGYYGSRNECNCTPAQIMKYHRKLSGPIMDRIDLHVDVDEIEHDKLLGVGTGNRSDYIRTRVELARQKQQKRYASIKKNNATLTNKDIKEHSKLDDKAKDLLDKAADRLKISARSYMKIVKIARTIADLEDSNPITTDHVSEALQYRPQISEVIF